MKHTSFDCILQYVWLKALWLLDNLQNPQFSASKLSWSTLCFCMYSIERCCLFCILDDRPTDDQPSFSTVPIPLMYLNKGESVIAGCSVTAFDSIPLAWAFENNTEILLTGFDIHIVKDVPLSLYGHTNLLVNSSEYDYHNATYLCQLLVESGNVYFSVPVTFFVYGECSKCLSTFRNYCT